MLRLTAIGLILGAIIGGMFQDGPPRVDSPTFTRDIAPIVFEKCAPCHRPGGSAPFKLLAYEDVGKRATQVSLAVSTEHMPPVTAATSFGQFGDVQPLTEEETWLVRLWVNEGAPKGVPDDLPPPPVFEPGWPLGEPDLVVLSPAYNVREDGGGFWRAFVLRPELEERRHLVGFDVRPATPHGVRHVVLAQDVDGSFARRERLEPGPGFGTYGSLGLPRFRMTSLNPPLVDPIVNRQSFERSTLLATWALGHPPSRFPVGVGYPLSPGDALVAQVLYQPSGKIEDGSVEIALYFAADQEPRPPQWLSLGRDTFEIPPDQRHVVLSHSLILDRSISILSLYPEARFLCRYITLLAIMPSGQARTLFQHSNWNPWWTGSFRFSRPVQLPKGTELRLSFTYDNSISNERLLVTPPRAIPFGYGESDELGWMHIEYLAD